MGRLYHDMEKAASLQNIGQLLQKRLNKLHDLYILFTLFVTHHLSSPPSSIVFRIFTLHHNNPKLLKHIKLQFLSSCHGLIHHDPSPLGTLQRTSSIAHAANASNLAVLNLAHRSISDKTATIAPLKGQHTSSTQGKYQWISKC